MKFTVEGANAQTGDDHTVIVSATSAAHAEAQAKSMGLLVSRVIPRTDEESISHALNYAPPRSGGTGPSREAVMNYLKTNPSNAPNYTGLQVAGFIIGAMAILSYGAAVVVFIALVNSASSAYGPSGVIGILIPISIAAGGAVQHGLAAACFALRDIARNSFRA